jgi:Pectate lyase superfamily protein/Divergent InlB B-repeat domain/Abnormal spindle-like microcephaly-assoc'd, ASPM-SPD-2-Hydin
MAIWQTFRRLSPILFLAGSLASTLAFSGANVPWTTYEAESMATTGTILGPGYAPNTVTAESSGRQCVQLTNGQYVQFTAQAPANSIVVRYSVPDTTNGIGADYTISLYTNGVFAEKLPLTSRYSWLYGNYPWANNPTAGSPRNFYDEVRTNGLSVNTGDVVRLQVASGDTAAYYIIDLVDLEKVALPLAQPSNSLSVISYGAGGAGTTDDTTALIDCITAANAHGNSVWLPQGTYKITGTINLPTGIIVQGAGMWYTTLIGDPVLYTNASRRVIVNGIGSNILLSDLSILGRLNYRNDTEPNDALGGSFGMGSTISRVWVEHSKTGAWIVNSQGLVVDSCRFRDTIADGINVDVGMQGTIVTNCTARGTGDDCFAMWPATYTSQTYTPGYNVFTHCTGQSPFLANGGALYGAVSNSIQDCLFQDLPYGCGILISTTFPVGGNVFSGTTVAERCVLNRCGGYDGGFGWRAALQLCLDHSSLSGININNMNITNSVSDAFGILAPGSSVQTGVGTLSNAIISNVSISNYGIGVNGRNALWASSNALGSLTISNSTIVEYRNDSTNFSFNFIGPSISATVTTSLPNLTYTVDGTNYSTQQTFNWIAGIGHTIAAASPQSGGSGIQYVWNSWSDGGAISHIVTPTSNTTYTATFSTQYFLNMHAGAGGSVSPPSGWTNPGAILNISATPTNGYVFLDWAAGGAGSYAGQSNPVSVTMNGPVIESASFAAMSKIISLSGTLSFGNVTVGASSNEALTISNAGNSVLTVSNASYPPGFSGIWSGAIPPGGSTNVTVKFSPTQTTNYSGNLTIFSDATSGSNTLSVSGTGVSFDRPSLGLAVNNNGTIKLYYTTTPGASYHIETTTNLSAASWITVAGSTTNAAGSEVTFTDPSPVSSSRYYRIVSP